MWSYFLTAVLQTCARLTSDDTEVEAGLLIMMRLVGEGFVTAVLC